MAAKSCLVANFYVFTSMLFSDENEVEFSSSSLISTMVKHALWSHCPCGCLSNVFLSVQRYSWIWQNLLWWWWRASLFLWRILQKKEESFQNLTDTKQQNMQVLQPRLDSSKQCIILLATNLAEPQWIAIVCLLFLLDHVVYVANDTREMNQSNILLTAIHAEKENS